MCWKKKEREFRGDSTFEVYYMYKVIRSCETPAQLEAAYTWAFRVIKGWEEQDESVAKERDLAYLWLRSVHERYNMYYTIISNGLEAGLVNMTNKSVTDKS